MEINPLSIVNILTLRYDPSLKPNLPYKTWADFKTTIDSPNILEIENSVCNYINQKLEVVELIPLLFYLYYEKLNLILILKLYQ